MLKLMGKKIFIILRSKNLCEVSSQAKGLCFDIYLDLQLYFGDASSEGSGKFMGLCRLA